MQFSFDLLGKECLEALLDDVGTLEREREVSTDAQRIDVWFSPDPSRHDERLGRGWLGRITDEACGIELFSDTPTPAELRACGRKHWAHQHARELAAAPEKVPLARAWIVSTGLPKTAIAAWNARPRRPWPRGFLLAHDELALGFIVLSRLPRTRATLALRLLAQGPTLLRACLELSALPDDAWEHRLVDVLVRWRVQVSGSASAPAPDQELFMQITHPLYEEFLRKTRQEAADQGMQKGMRQGMQQGMQQGLQQGLQQGMAALMRAFARRLGRALTEVERETLLARVGTHGADRLGDVVIDLAPDDLARWLRDPDAR